MLGDLLERFAVTAFHSLILVLVAISNTEAKMHAVNDGVVACIVVNGDFAEAEIGEEDTNFGVEQVGLEPEANAAERVEMI